MSLCIVCGQSNPDRDSFCSYHIAPEENWASGNRIMCDFFHRAVVPHRLPPRDRDAVEMLVDDEGEVVVLAASDH